MNTYKLHVSGTHCASCKILIEDILSEQNFIKSSDVNLKHETVTIVTSGEIDLGKVIEQLNEKIKPHGYTLSEEKIAHSESTDSTIWQALPIGILFIILFFLLQKSGILNLGIGGQATPVTGFLIGLVASVSSCLAIVGGLILSLSAKVAQDENSHTSKKQFALFHGGRLVGFALLGGVLGLVGEAVGVNLTFSAVLGIIASFVMIILGLNLAGLIKKNQATFSTKIFTYFRKIEHATLAPIVLGVGTFFLPCGFTQSMQVAALSSGSFVSGMSIMLAFALGTLPMLFILSFSSVSMAHSKYAPIFFKSAGVVVIGLGLFSLLAGLAGLGIINPLFSI